MENKNVKGGWSTASLVLGIIAMVLALLPLLSAWLMFSTWLNWFIVPFSIICGVVAIVKSQNLVKSIAGMVIGVLAFCMPIILTEQYVKSSVKSVGNMFETVDKLTDSDDDGDRNSYDDSDSDSDLENDLDDINAAAKTGKKAMNSMSKMLDAASDMAEDLEQLEDEYSDEDYEDLDQSIETSKKALKSALKMLDAMDDMLE